MFSILSIDGGGIRGIIPAKGLTMLEAELKRRNFSSNLSDYFDLICGTSTGAILALGIALGIPTSHMLDLYKENARIIFPKRRFNLVQTLIWNKPLYDRKALSELVEETYKNATPGEMARIGHCKTRVCIPTYDVSQGRMHVFKTSHHTQFDRDYQIPAHHVALSSAAAPMYFDSYDFEYELRGTSGKMKYLANVDGGVMANNPTLIGYVEAVQTLRINPQDIAILSLGTGDSILKDDTGIPQRMGLRYWLHNKRTKIAIYDLFSSAQSDYVSNLMKFYHRGPGEGGEQKFIYERIQHCFSSHDAISLSASDSNSLHRLENIGQQLYGDKLSVLIDTFCSETKEEFKPVHHF